MLILIEEEKLAVHKKHLETDKGKLKLFDQYFHLRKKSYEDSKESKRGFFLLTIEFSLSRTTDKECTHKHGSILS